MNIHQIERLPTDFQQPVAEEAIRLQLSRELAGETILEVAELQAGLFNNTYQVRTSGSDYILKVAPIDTADVFFNERHLMQRERTIASVLQSQSPLVPEYRAFFTVDGRDAFLQPFVEGQLWYDVIDELTDDENTLLWQQLGEFARTLHNCHGDAFGYPEPMGGFDRWSEFIEYNVAGMVEDCRRLGIFHPEAETYCSLLPKFADTLDQVTTPRLLHGDIWPRNVIIDGSGADIHLKAVFDGERAFWGDPCSDWVLILYGVPEAFWDGYGENLVMTRNPVCISIYKGMYFILNILETTRFNDSDEAARKWLASINHELVNALSAK